jgi:hypothetical protein
MLSFKPTCLKLLETSLPNSKMMDLYEYYSGSRRMSDLMSDFLHRFMDEECMYGNKAIEFCSGWGRNKYFVLLHHYGTVDLMD